MRHEGTSGTAKPDIVKVLLAEDEEDDAYFFRRSLRRSSDVELIWHAKDGDEVIQYLAGEGIFGDRREHPFPDVLVLDLKMPNRNGFEVLEWMRGKFPKLKIGVFSSSDRAEEIERARQLGAHLYQQKTHEPEKFRRFMHWLESLVRSERRPNI